MSTFCTLFAGAVVAKADRIVLVGGTVLEGSSTRRAGKVVVEVASGTITLPASAVTRIEKGESPLEHFEARYRALNPSDVPGRLALADYCGRHDLHGQERRLLQEVLALDGDNAVARARLGFVKAADGWVRREDADPDLVERDGRRVTPEQARAIDHAAAQALSARREREEAELAARRAELAARQAAFEAEQARSSQQAGAAFSTYVPLYAPIYRYPLPRHVAPAPCGADRSCRAPRPARPPASADSTTLSVVKVPYRNP